MKKNVVLLLCLIFTACREKTVDPITPSPTPIIQETKEQAKLNSIITPLKQSALDLTDDELKVLDELKSASIIGLGEATHGTKEFFDMKHRLFKYFVEHFNHKYFAFEMDYAESLIFDEYVQTGKGDIVQLMKDKMYFWTWNTVEVKNLLEWMKNYNQGKAEANRVHIFGIDCQTFKYNVPELVKRMRLIDLSIGNNVDLLLKPLLDITGEYKGGYGNNVVEVASLVSTNKDLIVSKSSLKEYQVLEHLANVVVQTEDYLKMYYTNSSYISGNVRDKYMADNVDWLKNQTPNPMSVWAHNLHVANEGNNMGKSINQTYQEKYRTIGFSFAEGSVTAVNVNQKKLAYNVFDSDVKEKYINQLFSQASSPNYIVKMADMFADESLKTYFMSKPFFQIGAGFYSPFELTNFTTLKAYNFTYLIHLNTSTHSSNYLLTP